MEKYDFAGWATRNDLLCADGRTIRKDAFKSQDGQIVPLVYGHQHNDVDAVLGHAVLENRDEGVYAYCSFNDTESGQSAKKLVEHGDVTSLSIYANKLKQKGGDVIHGVIRELSLVLAGANPGAYIDTVMAHSEDGEETIETLEASWDENIVLYHSDDPNKENEKMDNSKEKTVQEVLDTLTEEQKDAVAIVVGMALEDGEKDTNEEEDEDMKHNLFDQETETPANVITHSDQEEILRLAKSNGVGSFKAALEIYADDNDIQHDALASGFVQTGTGNITELFPEYKDVKPGAPELVTNDQGWISVVMNKVHKSPISRIRTRHVDIRNIQELRAKGYKKGKQKDQTGNFNLVTRTTDPQTVYVKNALHRDDVVDITDFDYVQYLYNIDQMMLKEELATAIMLGDGRENGADDKIAEDKIRPIWTDDNLYTIHVDLDITAARNELQGSGTSVSFGENYIRAEAMISTVLHARESFKGSGTPDMYIAPHDLNVMLLAKDMNGRRIYSSVSDLATALNVGKIYTVEQFAGKTRTDGNKTKKLLALIVNLNDYSLGSTKGGEITHFTDFDIDFNQLKSLLETRCSGALTKLWSAIAVEETVTTASDSTTDDSTSDVDNVG